MTNVIVFRPKSAVALAALAGVLLLLFVIQIIFYSEKLSFANLTTALLLGFGVWVIYIKPKMLVFDEGVSIVNPLITATVPFDEIDEISTRYALTLVTRGKKISVWAAPAPGRFHLRNIKAEELSGLELPTGGFISPGDSPRSNSGAAAQILKLRIKSVGSSADRVRASAKFSYGTASALVIGIACVLVLNFLHL